MKTRLLARSGGLTVLMILGTALATARAQDADPPGRVARLSDVIKDQPIASALVAVGIGYLLGRFTA